LKMNSIQEASDTFTKWKSLFPENKKLDRFEKVIQSIKNIAPHLDVLEDLFMPEYYRAKYVCEGVSGKDAFAHFLKIGLSEKCNPNPWFDGSYFEKEHGSLLHDGEIPLIGYIRMESDGLVKPNPLFDPAYYRKSNADIAENQSMLAHYVKFGQIEGRPAIEKYLPEVIYNEYKEMLVYEPKLLSAAEGINEIIRYPRVDPSMFVPGNVKKQVQGDIAAVVCVPFVTRGGADLISTYLLRALQEHFGIERVLLIVTESVDVELTSWFNDKTKIVLFGMEANYRSSEDKTLALHNTIGKFTPEVVFNVNSKTCWEMYKCYGKQLSTVTSLYAYLFCHDYDNDRNRVGYVSGYLSETLSYLDGVAIDNETLINDLLDEYRFSTYNSSKLRTVYTPFTQNSLKYEPNENSEGVLWIGRLSEQKRPDVLLKIAERMQYQQFFVYGPPGDAEESDLIISNSISNITYMGTYEKLDEIEFSYYKLFLHTAEWEGLPTTLIQMMGIGIPIVTSDVGGVKELVNERTGTLVEECDDLDDYCVKINQAFVNYKEILDKAEYGSKFVRNRQSWDNYIDSLHTVGVFGAKDKSSIFKLSDDCVDIA